MTSNFSERLQDERKRMGLSQEAFGKLGKVEKNSQFLYEKGTRLPDAEYLIQLHANHVDVLYLLSGERTESGASERIKELLAVLNKLAPTQMAMGFALINMLTLCGNDARTAQHDADAIWRASRLATQFLELDNRGRLLIEEAAKGAANAPAP